jgi:hypothetical protein
LIVSPQAFERNAAEEHNSRIPAGQLAKVTLVVALSRDQQVGILVVAKQRNYVVQPFDLLEPADEEKVWTLVRTLERGRCVFPFRIRKEVRYDFHLVRKAELMMLRPTELAHGNESVEMLELAAQESGQPPPLRRPAINQLTAKALSLIAELAVVPPQHVRWTNKPVLVRHVQLGRVSTVGENAGSADKGRVVKVDDVEAAVIENRPEAARIRHWPACLLSQ